MLTKSFALATVVALGGAVVWSGCSSDDGVSPTTGGDAGNSAKNDAGTGEDSGDTGPVDSGATDSGAAPTVDITYGCGPFGKCDSDISGSWTVSGGCVEDDAFAAAKAKCPGLQESDVVIKASGTVVATATMIERKTTVSLSAKVAVPKSCAPIEVDCATIAGVLQAGGFPGVPTFDSATCTGAGDTCNCAVTASFAEDANDAYTAADGVLTTTNPTRTFDYCVFDNRTDYRETTTPAAGEFVLPVHFELSK